jgi:hypothetical protein
MVGIACDYRAGVIGGPWLIGVDPWQGLGYVNGNYSYVFMDKPHRVFSPYYGALVRDLYQVASV